MDENLKDLHENLALLTQKTEDPKGIKGTLLPSPPSTHTHTHSENVIELNCKVIKRWQSPISTSMPPFQVYSPFLAKNFVPPPPPSELIFGRSYPLIIRGRGAGEGFQL